MQNNTQEHSTTAFSDVQDKRAGLLNAERKVAIGRRESPEPYDPRPKRMMYLRGLLLGAAVVVIALVLIIVLAPGIQIG